MGMSPPTSCSPTASRALEPPFLCLVASGGHTLLAHVPTWRASRCSAAPSMMPPERRSTRARGCSASGFPGARRWNASRSGGDGRLCVPGRPRTRPGTGAGRPPGVRQGLDFSFAGVKTALQYAGARLSKSQSGPARPRPRRLLPGGHRRRAHQLESNRRWRVPGWSGWRVGGGVAANGELRRASAAGGHRPHDRARPVHRQRRDDRRRCPLRHNPYPGIWGWMRLRAANARDDLMLTVFSRPGCHLCDRAVEGPARPAVPPGVRAAGARHPRR